MSHISRPIKIDLKLINQAEIARRLGISAAYVNMILSGQRKSDKYKDEILSIIKLLKAQ